MLGPINQRHAKYDQKADKLRASGDPLLPLAAAVLVFAFASCLTSSLTSGF